MSKKNAVSSFNQGRTDRAKSNRRGSGWPTLISDAIHGNPHYRPDKKNPTAYKDGWKHQGDKKK